MHIFSTEPGDALPATLCSSVNHLERFMIRPPAGFQPAAELLQNLSNTEILIMTTINKNLVEAFAAMISIMLCSAHVTVNEFYTCVY
jgi:hypothetical protein